MRIISGTHRGRRFNVPPSVHCRPTAERVREAIFSSLESMRCLAGVAVLDLFSGTAALGIEALSRGARYCHFIEKDQVLSQHTEKVLADFGLASRSAVSSRDVQEVFLGPKRDFPEGICFDLIFADPPYAKFSGEQVLELLLSSSVISEGSLLVFEGDRELTLSQKAHKKAVLSPVLKKDRNYGETVVSYIVFE